MMALKIAALCVCAASVGAASDDAAPAKADPGRARTVERTWERYREIVARNIFSRERRAFSRDAERAAARESAGPEGGGGAPRSETKSPDRPGRWVLLGVSKVGDRLLGFFEDTDATIVRHAAAGETLGVCTLTAISLDSVTVRVEDKERTVAVGYTLGGEIAPARESVATSNTSPPSRPGVTAPTQPTGAAPEKETPSSSEAAPAAGSDSVLERLLRRRQQEVGGPGS